VRASRVAWRRFHHRFVVWSSFGSGFVGSSLIEAQSGSFVPRAASLIVFGIPEHLAQGCITVRNSPSRGRSLGQRSACFQFYFSSFNLVAQQARQPRAQCALDSQSAMHFARGLRGALGLEKL